MSFENKLFGMLVDNKVLKPGDHVKFFDDARDAWVDAVVKTSNEKQSVFTVQDRYDRPNKTEDRVVKAEFVDNVVK